MAVGGGPGERSGQPRPPGPPGATPDPPLERELAELVRRAAEADVDTAVAQRRRAAWLARQAAGEATLPALLAALAERASPIVVELRDGRHHRGRPIVVGRDVVELDTSEVRVLVATGAVAAVRTADHRPVDPTGTWPPATAVTDLATELARWAEDQPWVLVRTAERGPALRGTLLTAGRDVLVLRLEGGDVAYVPLAALAEVSLPESG